jgi:hypothetical protein
MEENQKIRHFIINVHILNKRSLYKHLMFRILTHKKVFSLEKAFLCVNKCWHGTCMINNCIKKLEGFI